MSDHEKNLKNSFNIQQRIWFKEGIKNIVVVNGWITKKIKNSFFQDLPLSQKIPIYNYDLYEYLLNQTIWNLEDTAYNLVSGIKKIKNKVVLDCRIERVFKNTFKQDLSFAKHKWDDISVDLICAEINLIIHALDRIYYEYEKGYKNLKNKIRFEQNGLKSVKNSVKILSGYRYIEHNVVSNITYQEV